MLTGCQPFELHTDTHVLMGTFVEVISPDERAAGIVFDEVKRIEKLLSKYDPESEISRFNRTGHLKASADTYDILKISREFWRETHGAFDITVGPLLDIWGFTKKDYRQPSEAQILETMKKVGTDKLVFDDAQQAVTAGVPGMKLDLGAIAKGYALDRAAQKLRSAGITSCLINAGGQVLALGHKSLQPWVIGIRDPGGKPAKRHVMLTDQSASTSADYEQYFTFGRKRYGHIFDPKTGYPVQSDIRSVTVIASSATTADALSTSLYALDKDARDALIKKHPDAMAITQ